MQQQQQQQPYKPIYWAYPTHPTSATGAYPVAPLLNQQPQQYVKGVFPHVLSQYVAQPANVQFNRNGYGATAANTNTAQSFDEETKDKSKVVEM